MNGYRKIQKFFFMETNATLIVLLMALAKLVNKQLIESIRIAITTRMPARM